MPCTGPPPSLSFLIWLLSTTAVLLALTCRTAGAVSRTAESPQGQQQHRHLAPTTELNSTTTQKNHYVFAVVPKSLEMSFFDPVRDGCHEQAARLSQRHVTVECLYVGPATADAQAQADIVQALIWGPNDTTTSDSTTTNTSSYPPIDGLAISVSNEAILTPILQKARQTTQISIVTFDSDAPESGRSYYIGTNNSFMGAQLARTMETLRPMGGTFGILTQSSPNLQIRVQGIFAELNHASNSDIQQWSSLPDSPFDTELNITRTFDQMTRWVTQNKPDVLVSVLGFPMSILNDNITRQSNSPWKNFVDTITRNRNITLVCADAQPHQIDMLQKNYVDGLVGQLPHDMGTKSIDTLYRMATDPANANQLGDHWEYGTPKEEKYIIGTNVLTYTHIPLHLPPVDVDNNLIGGLQYVGYTLFIIVALTSLSFGFWAFYRRKVRVVRVAQPRFLIMIALGVLIMACCMIPLGMDDGAGSGKYPGCFDGEVELMERCTAICMSIPWLFCCGFSITFSALYSKTRRVSKIFHSNSAFGRVKVTEADVLIPFFVLFSLNVIILVTWTIVDPSTYVRVPDFGRDGWNRVISTRGECSSENVEYFLIPLGVVNLGVLLLANWQAYEARDIESEFAETKYIGICMGSLLQAMITGIPVIFVVSDIPQAFYMIFVLLIFVVSMVVLMAIFVPKIMFTREYMQLSPKEQQKFMTDIIKRTAKQSSHIRTSNAKRRSGPSTPFGRLSSWVRPSSRGSRWGPSSRPSDGSAGSAATTPPIGRQANGSDSTEGTPPMPGSAENSRPTTNSGSSGSSDDMFCMAFYRRPSLRDIADMQKPKYPPPANFHAKTGNSSGHHHPTTAAPSSKTNLYQEVIEEGDESDDSSEQNNTNPSAHLGPVMMDPVDENEEAIEAAVPLPPALSELTEYHESEELFVSGDSQVFASTQETTSEVSR